MMVSENEKYNRCLLDMWCCNSEIISRVIMMREPHPYICVVDCGLSYGRFDMFSVDSRKLVRRVMSNIAAAVDKVFCAANHHLVFTVGHSSKSKVTTVIQCGMTN